MVLLKNMFGPRLNALDAKNRMGIDWSSMSCNLNSCKYSLWGTHKRLYLQDKDRVYSGFEGVHFDINFQHPKSIVAKGSCAFQNMPYL